MVNVFTSSVSSLLFIFLFLPYPSVSSSLLSFLPLFFVSLGQDTKWPARLDVSFNSNTINQYVLWVSVVRSSLGIADKRCLFLNCSMIASIS